MVVVRWLVLSLDRFLLSELQCWKITDFFFMKISFLFDLFDQQQTEKQIKIAGYKSEQTGNKANQLNVFIYRHSLKCYQHTDSV